MFPGWYKASGEKVWGEYTNLEIHSVENQDFLSLLGKITAPAAVQCSVDSGDHVRRRSEMNASRTGQTPGEAWTQCRVSGPIWQRRRRWMYNEHIWRTSEGPGTGGGGPENFHEQLYRKRPYEIPDNIVQFSSVAQSCLTLCDPLNRSTPGLPVHHQLPESTQTHVHWVGDAIQPSHPGSSPSPPALNPSQHQSLFQWVNSSHEVAKVLEFQL